MKHFIKELEQFFVFYNKQRGKKFEGGVGAFGCVITPSSDALGLQSRSTTRWAEVLGDGSTGELLGQHSGEVHDRSAWPITRHDVLSFSGGVVLDQNDTADGLAVELRNVVLDEAIRASRGRALHEYSRAGSPHRLADLLQACG